MVKIRSSFLIPSVVFFFTVLLLGSIVYQTVAEPETRGKSASCNSCHSSSIYLTVDIRTVEAPSTILKGESDWINVTVDVSASHRSSVWSGFSIDVWLESTGRMNTGSHKVLTGQSPQGSSSPYSWSDNFDFQVTAIGTGTDTVTAKAKMDPVHESPPVTDTQQVQVEIPNNDPELSSGTVEPLSGYPDEPFNFQVEYTDLDNDPPSSIKVFIDGTPHALSDLDGGDGSVIDGEIFGVSGIYLDEGMHSFHFEASDGNAPVRFPASGEIEGPEVLHRNLPPDLKQGYVTPAVGRPGDLFTYYVTYYDPENDPPSPYVGLAIDDVENSTSMEEDDSVSGILNDGSYINGELFKAEIELGLGDHTYYFNASDGDLYDMIGPYYGPDVQEAPSMAAVIENPINGSSYLSNESVQFTGSFSSNVEVQDGEALWFSNISGSLGGGWSFKKQLIPGRHLITLKVSSGLQDLSDEDHTEIIVSDPVIIPEIDLISGFMPDEDPSIDELENITFSVSLDPEHPLLVDDVALIKTWYLDGLVRASGVLEWTYRTSYLDSGDHLIRLEIMSSGELVASEVWNLAVIDIPAPVILTGDVIEDLGIYEKRDTLRITLPVQDPAGRDLTVAWFVDGEQITGSEPILLLELRQGPWAREGDHVLTAVVTNPDGVELQQNFTYSVLSDELFDDDDDEDDDQVDDEVYDDEEGKDRDLFGIAIIVIGTIVILVGIINTVLSLLSREKIAGIRQENAEEIWEDEADREEAEDLWGGDI